MAGIYVHIPFCRSKCAYCDFYSMPLRDEAVARATVGRLLDERDARAGELGGLPVTTVYVGGGTPSSLPAEALACLLDGLAVHNAGEFTVELNPDDVTPTLARILAGAGVNRVSMGVQSLDDNELRAVGRRHTAAQALRAVDTIVGAGITNISLDIILGLPGQTPESFSRSLEGLIATGVPHFSAYILSYEPGTRLTARLNAGKTVRTPDEVIATMYDALTATARNAGFEHYEISNYARPGMHSRHNSAYWDMTPYLGLGPGAHSLAADGTRRFNPSNLKGWLAAEPGRYAVVDTESTTDRVNDMIITALRTSAGLSLDLLADRFGDTVAREVRRSALRHIASGNLVEIGPQRLAIPEERWIVSDPIMADLMIL